MADAMTKATTGIAASAGTQRGTMAMTARMSETARSAVSTPSTTARRVAADCRASSRS